MDAGELQIPPAGSRQAVDAEAFSALLLDLYRYSRELTMGQFQRRVLERLGEVLPFDCAWWGMSRDDLELHSSFLYRLPARYTDVWEVNKQDDELAAAVIAAPGITVHYDIERENGAPGLRRLLNSFGIRETLCTLIAHREVKLHTFLSLYRQHGSPPFTPAERAFKQLVMPHLWATWTSNWIAQIDHIRAHSAVSRTALAVTDQRATLHGAEPRFLELVRRDWPAWTGPELPPPLREALRTQLKVCGEHTVMRAFPVCGLHLIEIRARSPLDRLTPREMTIAQGFGSGQSYKALAATLQLSPSTVRAHLRAIYDKLGISDKAELAHLLEMHLNAGALTEPPFTGTTVAE